MSKIVVLMGSPRKNGNTDKLSEAFIKAARAAGHQISKFSVGQMKVNGCLACNYCVRNHGECVQKDEMQDIYRELKTADTVVFASPVYYFGFSAQLKAVIDRFYASATEAFPIKSVVMLATMEGEVNADTAALLSTYKTINEYMGWQDKGTVIVGGTSGKDDILNHPGLLEAEELARQI